MERKKNGSLKGPKEQAVQEEGVGVVRDGGVAHPRRRVLEGGELRLQRVRRGGAVAQRAAARPLRGQRDVRAEGVGEVAPNFLQSFVGIFVLRGYRRLYSV